MKTYLCAYLGSALLALFTTPAVIWLAQRIKAVDRPGVRSVHERPIPRIGGVAIFISTVWLIIVLLYLDTTIGDAFKEIRPQLTTLLCSGTFIFLIGLGDDVKGLPARFKFLAELLAAGALAFVGVRISSVAISEQWTLHLGLLSWPVTLLWIVGITNAVNLSDGLDGLAAGISAMTCGVIAVFAVHGGHAVMAVLMLALLGSLTGFLFFNFNPARIFMGDCGSLFLGFTIASSAVLCSMKSSALVGLALPVLALGIPIFDTLFAMLRRFIERRSVCAPDRSHFHHRLLELGLSQRQVVMAVYVVTLIATGLGMFMLVTRNIHSLVVFFCILLLLLLVFRLVGAVRLREVIAGLQQKYAVGCQIKRETEIFEQVQLHFRQAKTFDEWWQAMCVAAEQLNFSRLYLPLDGSHSTIPALTWQRNGNEHADPVDKIEMKIPFPGLNHGQQLSVEFDVSADSSLESAGRRAVLLTRLLTERKVAELPRSETGILCVGKKPDVADVVTYREESFVATSHNWSS